EVALWLPLPELAAADQDCAVTRAERSGSKVWTRVVCSGREPATPSASASASATPAKAAAAPAARSIEIRAGNKVLATSTIGASSRVEEVAVALPEGAPDQLRAVLTGSDAI